MKEYEVVERKIIALADGRSLSLHEGVQEINVPGVDNERLIKELLDSGAIRNPRPAPKGPVLENPKKKKRAK